MTKQSMERQVNTCHIISLLPPTIMSKQSFYPSSYSSSMDIEPRNIYIGQNFNIPKGKSRISLGYRMSPPGELSAQFRQFVFDFDIPGTKACTVKGYFYKGVSQDSGNMFDFGGGVIRQLHRKDIGKEEETQFVSVKYSINVYILFILYRNLVRLLQVLLGRRRGNVGVSTTTMRLSIWH